MDKKIQTIKTPDYHRIYKDLIEMKYPEKKEITGNIMKKKNLSYKDMEQLNELIFGIPDKNMALENRNHRSYQLEDIRYILKFQLKNNINNTETARYFKLSRNTVTHWKKKVKL